MNLDMRNGHKNPSSLKPCQTGSNSPAWELREIIAPGIMRIVDKSDIQLL